MVEPKLSPRVRYLYQIRVVPKWLTVTVVTFQRPSPSPKIDREPWTRDQYRPSPIEWSDDGSRESYTETDRPRGNNTEIDPQNSDCYRPNDMDTDTYPKTSHQYLPTTQVWYRNGSWKQKLIPKTVTDPGQTIRRLIPISNPDTNPDWQHKVEANTKTDPGNDPILTVNIQTNHIPNPFRDQYQSSDCSWRPIPIRNRSQSRDRSLIATPKPEVHTNHNI